MNFNNSRLVDHKPMKFGTFVPYMYCFVIIVKYLTNFFKLEWNLGIKFTLRFFFLSVYLLETRISCSIWKGELIPIGEVTLKLFLAQLCPFFDLEFLLKNVKHALYISKRTAAERWHPHAVLLFYFTAADAKCRVVAIKHLPYFNIVQIIFLFLFGLLSSFWFKNQIPLKSVLGGAYGGHKLHSCIWIKLILLFLFFWVFFVSKGNILDIYFA